MAGEGEGPAIGIDVSIGVLQHDRLEIVTDDQGDCTTPSYVASTDTEQLVRDAAKNQDAMNPTNTVLGLQKRHVEKKEEGEMEVQQEMAVQQEVAAVLVAPDEGTTIVVETAELPTPEGVPMTVGAPSPLSMDAPVASWLRMAVDGLVSTAAIMMGVGAVEEDNARAMVLSGFAVLFAGTVNIAIGELVAVYSQRDIEAAQTKRGMKSKREAAGRAGELRSTVRAAVAPALSYMLGAVVPLMAACMIREHRLRLAAMAVATSSALVAVGCLGAIQGGKAPMVRGGARVLFWGWIATVVTFFCMKSVEHIGL